MEQLITKKLVNDLSYRIIGAAIEVHKVFGPGLLESNYEEAFLHECGKIRGMDTKTQQPILVAYKDIVLQAQMRYDVLVEDLIVVENKSVKEILPIHIATLLSYMKHLKVPKGIIINYNVTNIWKDGQQTFVNEYFAELPDE